FALESSDVIRKEIVRVVDIPAALNVGAQYPRSPPARRIRSRGAGSAETSRTFVLPCPVVLCRTHASRAGLLSGSAPNYGDSDIRAARRSRPAASGSLETAGATCLP